MDRSELLKGLDRLEESSGHGLDAEDDLYLKRLRSFLTAPPPPAEQASGDTEQQARELFATHLERYGYRHGAAAIREGRDASYDSAAIAAITAALLQRPVVDEPTWRDAERMDAIKQMRLAVTPVEGGGWDVSVFDADDYKETLVGSALDIRAAIDEAAALAPQQPTVEEE